MADIHFYPPDPTGPDPSELLPVIPLGSDNSREDEMGKLIPGPMGMIDIVLTATAGRQFPGRSLSLATQTTWGLSGVPEVISG